MQFQRRKNKETTSLLPLKYLLFTPIISKHQSDIVPCGRFILWLETQLFSQFFLQHMPLRGKIWSGFLTLFFVSFFLLFFLLPTLCLPVFLLGLTAVCYCTISFVCYIYLITAIYKNSGGCFSGFLCFFFFFYILFWSWNCAYWLDFLKLVQETGSQRCSVRTWIWSQLSSVLEWVPLLFCLFVQESFAGGFESHGPHKCFKPTPGLILNRYILFSPLTSSINSTWL